MSEEISRRPTPSFAPIPLPAGRCENPPSPQYQTLIHLLGSLQGLFVNPVFTKRIVELSKDESDLLLDYLGKIFTQNHDLQVRFKWNKNDLAIWSNTSTVHSATFDFTDPRAGDRAVSLGEKPYLDKSAPSRRQALGLPSFH